MKSGRFTKLYKRKESLKTNYGKRLKILKSRKTRLVIRRSLNGLTVQFVNYNPKGDLVLLSVNSKSLRKLGWKFHLGNVPSAYLTGLLCGIKSKDKNIEEAVLDLGAKKTVSGSVLYAALKGVLDAGIKVPHDKKILPSNDAVSGKNVIKLSEHLKKDSNKFNKQFSSYIKNNVNINNIEKDFNETKKKIIGNK